MNETHLTYGNPGLPRELLYEVKVEEKRSPERVRASDAAEARRRARRWLGYTPIEAEEIEEETDE